MNRKTRYLTQGAVIAALYVALTFLANELGLASQVIQVRFSEALTILPLFTPAAIPGVVIGCALANLLTGAVIWDIIFGPVATLLGALGTRYLARKYHILAPVFPILTNAIIVPFILMYAYGSPDSYWFMFATVGAGEIISCGVLGFLLYKVVVKANIFSSDMNAINAK